MNLKASNKLIAHIKASEGCRLYAYRDSVGVATIGYGSTKGVRMGMAITQQVADARLIDDIHDVIVQLERLNLPLNTQGKVDAIIDFCFNLGVTKFKSSTLYKYILGGMSNADIQKQIKRWVYAGSKKLPGLVKRREWEAARWVEKD